MWNIQQFMTAEVNFLEENTGLGIRLRKLNNAIRRYLDHNSAIMRELDNLTCSNKWIMGYLFEAEEEGRDVFQRDLEQNFGITRSTVSKVLKLLEKKELIKRESVSHDARLKKLVLTEKSRELGREMRREAEEMDKRLRSGFSPEEIELMCSFIKRMQNNIFSAYASEKICPKGDKQ